LAEFPRSPTRLVLDYVTTSKRVNTIT